MYSVSGVQAASKCSGIRQEWDRAKSSITRRAIRVAPAPAPAPVAQKPSGGSRFLRALGVLFLVAVLAAVIAVVVLVVTDAGQSTDLGEFISDEINDQIDKLRELVQDNTQ